MATKSAQTQVCPETDPWDFFNWPNIRQEAKARLIEARSHPTIWPADNRDNLLEYWCAWAAHANAISVLTSPPSPQGEWRDIATAPKDGTRFWGNEGDDAIAMFWHPKFEAFVSSYRQMTMAPGYTFNGEAQHDHSPEVHEPTHWRPLPFPPSTEQGEGK